MIAPIEASRRCRFPPTPVSRALLLPALHLHSLHHNGAPCPRFVVSGNWRPRPSRRSVPSNSVSRPAITRQRKRAVARTRRSIYIDTLQSTRCGIAKLAARNHPRTALAASHDRLLPGLASPVPAVLARAPIPSRSQPANHPGQQTHSGWASCIPRTSGDTLRFAEQTGVRP